MKIHLGAGFCEEDTGEYYVYTHSVAGHGVFYVGKGKGYRIGENFGRNSDWLKIADKYGLDEIVRDKLVTNICEEFAKLLEAELIEKYDMLGIPIVNRLIGCLNYGYTTSFKDKNPYFNKGVNNPGADKNIHHFIRKDGEEFVGTRVAFTEKYGFSPHVLFKPKSKLSYKTHNGWTLKGREFYNQEGENSRVSDKKRYLFRNDDGREFTGLRTAFSKEYGIQSKRLFGKRAMKVYFGWRVVECLDKD
jgi:hypothetical protein